MDEQASIWYCLQRIEKQVDWKPSTEWTDHDFKLLKREIQDTSGISISTHTLKRLFGKIKYKDGYSPQHATKNALAIFIGFDSWEDYLRQSGKEIEEFANSGVPLASPVRMGIKTGKRRILFWAFLAAGLIGAALTVYLMAGRSRLPDAAFSLKNTTGTVPHTVTFRYDIPESSPIQLYIDFDFVHPTLGGDFILMDSERNLLNHTYQIPGVYHPRLMAGNAVLDSGVVVAGSDGWVTFYQEAGSGQEYFWMDNMVQELPFDGALTLRRPDIERYGFDSTGIYYITHRNIRDFGLDADHFRLKVRFRNGPANGGISCFDSRIKVIGTQSESYVRMMEENCHQFCNIKFGEKEYSGQTSDLSYLSRDLSGWNTAVMEVIDRQAAFHFNGEQLFSESYSRKSGPIKGLEFRFKGSGMVDYLLLSSPESDTVYFTGFGRPENP